MPPPTQPETFPLIVVCLDIYRQGPHSASRAQRTSFCLSITGRWTSGPGPSLEGTSPSPREGCGVARGKDVPFRKGVPAGAAEVAELP